MLHLLITPSRIQSLKTKLQNYHISHDRDKGLMIIELIEDYYKDYKDDGPEFIDAFAMIYDEINQEPDDYDFDNRSVLLFILRFM